MRPYEPTAEDIDDLLKRLELEEICMREETLEEYIRNEHDENSEHEGCRRPRSCPYED